MVRVAPRRKPSYLGGFLFTRGFLLNNRYYCNSIPMKDECTCLSAYSYNATEDDLAAMILEYQVALATNGESNNLSPDCLSCYSTASTYVEQTSR